LTGLWPLCKQHSDGCHGTLRLLKHPRSKMIYTQSLLKRQYYRPLAPTHCPHI
jgi:hypothetical protein